MTITRPVIGSEYARTKCDRATDIRMLDPLTFNLATPDPRLSYFEIAPADQLPGRPKKGEVPIKNFFDHLELFATQKQKSLNGDTGEKIRKELADKEMPVLGLNAWLFLYEHQHLIPKELRGRVTLAFWGSVVPCSPEGHVGIYTLRWKAAPGWKFWKDGSWERRFSRIDTALKDGHFKAVLLKKS